MMDATSISDADNYESNFYKTQKIKTPKLQNNAFEVVNL